VTLARFPLHSFSSWIWNFETASSKIPLVFASYQSKNFPDGSAIAMEQLIRSLPNLLSAAGDAKEVCEVAALVAWRRVAGEGLRGQAVPYHLYGKTLVVAVADTTWKKQLEAVSGELLFRLNSLLGQPLVTYIEFRVDLKTVRAERAAHSIEKRDRDKEELSALSQVSDDVRSAADEIHDDELRHRFLVAAGRCIGRMEGG